MGYSNHAKSKEPVGMCIKRAHEAASTAQAVRIMLKERETQIEMTQTGR